jgi:DNA-directed RNA polymerase, mitochondrial
VNLAILPDEFERSKSKIAKSDQRAERSSGWGATTGGLALVNRYHERLTEGFRIALLDVRSGIHKEPGLVVTLRGLPPELLALVSIQTLLHSIGFKQDLVETLSSLGAAVAAECWAAKLTSDCPKINQRIAMAAKSVKERHGSVKRRQDAMERKITKAIEAGAMPKSFKTRRWSEASLQSAGGWLFNVVSTTLEGVFEFLPRTAGGSNALTVSEAGMSIVDQALDQAMVHNPVYWPTPVAPKPWTGWDDGGSWDERVYATVLRSHNKDTPGAVKNAIKTGTMQPALDAINALQAVAYTINIQVLEVIEACDAQGIHVKGLVPNRRKREPKPHAFAWEAMEPAQQARFWQKNAEIDKRNRGLIGDRLLFAEDQKTAFAMLEHKRFHTPLNCDWRGRIYGLSHFNFQREDRVRALFLFADGLPIGDEGLDWLKMHTANCGDFSVTVSGVTGKISKRPIKERIDWCNDNIQLITNTASAPLVHTEWMDADKPFLFLAACFELSAALERGSSFITRLPISFDGSCSGLQHLCMMTRAEEGSMVNLTSSPLPQDVYQVIADDTYAAVAADEENADLAKLFLEFDGDRRKIAKRNVMTFAYSSKKFGMSAQQQVDLMEPLAGDVLDGKMEEHPFEGYQHGPLDKKTGNRHPSKAARFIAGHIYTAIVERIKKPAEAMEFLQDIAKAMAHEGKPVLWTTPVGIPWINRYHGTVVKSVQMFLNDSGVRRSTRISVAVGQEKDIDKGKASNSVAPNFVHALDGSHLMLTANAAVSEGITSIATVHDSFGCLAPQAARFNAIIREQFSQMYIKHDVLNEILEQARADLTHANWKRLPDPIEYGTLNPKDILNAEFAFA